MGIKATTIKWASRLFRRIAGRTIQQYVEDARRDAVAMQQLDVLLPMYHPWTKPALRPQSVVTILNDIIINNRRNIVELGGGISTLYIAKVVEMTGGVLYTIEQDKQWADLLERQLEDLGVSGRAKVIHSRILQSSYALKDYKWYDSGPISEAISDNKIDLLLVDGPIYADKEALIRYGALPFFEDKMSDRYMIALDDARRSGERKVVDLWEEEYGLSFKTQGDLAMCIRGQAYVPYP